MYIKPLSNVLFEGGFLTFYAVLRLLQRLHIYSNFTRIKMSMHPYDGYTDENLFELLKAGDKYAFDEIYQRYWDKLFVTAQNRLGNNIEAEDIVQEVLLKLWINHATLNLEAKLNTYLSVAVKYEVLNRLAKKERHLRYQALANHKDADLSTEQFLSLAALQNQLAGLVKALPEKCRLVFTLSRENGLSQKEIAAQLQISENTVESHLKKALKNLRKGIQHIFIMLH